MSRIATSVCHTTGRYPPPWNLRSARNDDGAEAEIASIGAVRVALAAHCVEQKVNFFLTAYAVRGIDVHSGSAVIAGAGARPPLSPKSCGARALAILHGTVIATPAGLTRLAGGCFSR